MEFGALSLIPPLVVIVLAVLMRRSFEALTIGCLVGYLMIDFHQFPSNFIDSLLKTLQDPDMVWVILVCGLYGSLIHLMIESGGAYAFGHFMLRYIRTRRSSLIVTWIMGIIIFIDDYMSALAVGATLRKITDNYRVPRETLAYVVNTTAAPVCVIIPMSTWSIYCGNLLEKNGVVGSGQAFMGFLYTIPYNFYAWIAVLISLLLAMGRFPLIGKLKVAEARVKAGGPISPGGAIPEMKPDDLPQVELSKAKPIYFFLPLIVLMVATLALDKDALKGALFAVVFTVLYYAIIGLMPYEKISDGVFEGFKSMIFALAILTMSYVLKNVGDAMGLTPYVINSVKGVLNKELLPFGVFVSLSAISYATSSSWGLYAVAIPIVVPVAHALGANVWMTLSAVIGSGAFGSNASFYSDVTILTATSTECNNLEHSFSQLPYALIALGAASVMYLVFGFIL